MPKITKSQAKRLVRDIQSKASKLYLAHNPNLRVVNVKDMEAIERLTAKWLKRLG